MGVFCVTHCAWGACEVQEIPFDGKYGDMTRLSSLDSNGKFVLLCGGTNCQAGQVIVPKRKDAFVGGRRYTFTNNLVVCNGSEWSAFNDDLSTIKACAAGTSVYYKVSRDIQFGCNAQTGGGRFCTDVCVIGGREQKTPGAGTGGGDFLPGDKIGKCMFPDGKQYEVGKIIEYDCSSVSGTDYYANNAKTGKTCYLSCMRRSIGGEIENVWSVKNCASDLDKQVKFSMPEQVYRETIPGFKKCVAPVTPETGESDCVKAGGTWSDDGCICNDPSRRYSAVSRRCLRDCDYYAENPSEAPSGRLDCCKVPSSVAKWQDNACVCTNGQVWNFNANNPNSSCDETDIDYTDDYDNGGGAVVPGTVDGVDPCPAVNGLKVGANGACECLAEQGYTEPVMESNSLVRCDKPGTGGGGNEEINIVYKSKCDKLVAEDVATWENGVCNCVDTTKRYDADQNACVPRCNEAVATWDGTQCKCNQENYIYANDNCTENPQVVAQRLNEKQAAYDAAKENEQSLANRSLGALSTAATGLGMKEAFQGYAEKKADAAAADDMAAYIETMRCTYGDGKSVKAGNTPIELPGGNDESMMSLRSEYLALAASLKERKESLDMKAGIESEVILDKATMGLYDQENTGITGGAYSSLYRANMLSSEKDQSKIDADAEKSDKRLKYGATAAAVGIVGGIVANNIINGDNAKSDQVGTETKRLLAKEADALDDLKQCLSDAGVKNTDGLMFENFFPSVFSVNRIDCKRDLYFLRDKDASDLFADSTSETVIYNKLVSSGFSNETISKMVGSGTSADQIKKKIKSSIETTRGKFKDATVKDKKSAESLGLIFNEISNNGDGLKDLSALFSGFGSGSQFDLSQYSQSN